jgi:arginase family enzyme
MKHACCTATTQAMDNTARLLTLALDESAHMSRIYPPVSLIGVPTDIGAGHRGARMGPDALRIAGFGEALAARGVDVADRGNLNGPVRGRRRCRAIVISRK